ncbi:MAG: hypothetical protein KIPDCIKN_03107 [Haliscomenobacter sp.]|jgi:hypothetical protein|nr:hypothetical protein [Haliscomenobacter sp.]
MADRVLEMQTGSYPREQAGFYPGRAVSVFQEHKCQRSRESLISGQTRTIFPGKPEEKVPRRTYLPINKEPKLTVTVILG